MPNLLATKPIDVILGETHEEGQHALKRALGATNLITLGIGAIIGAGIFVLTGAAAAQYAGPAIVLSFILAGIACAFAGLCYSEFFDTVIDPRNPEHVFEVLGRDSDQGHHRPGAGAAIFKQQP